MQKLDLRNNIKKIILALKSEEILEIFSGQPNKAVRKGDLLRLMIESKRGFDNTIILPEFEIIYKQFSANSIYETEFFAQILSFIPSVPNENRNTYLTQDAINKFYSFHSSLLSTFNLIDMVMINDKSLFDEQNNFDIEKAKSEGNLILQVIDDENVRLEKLNKILESCYKLIETVFELLKLVDSEKIEEIPRISLIDSGSDINFIIKIPKKAANKISELLNEFWEFVANNRGCRLKKKNEAIENSLSILKQLNDAREEKVIDPESAERLKLGIIQNTENIVFNNTLPKELLQENKVLSNRDILLSRTQILLLEKPNNEIDSPEENS